MMWAILIMSFIRIAHPNHFDFFCVGMTFKSESNQLTQPSTHVSTLGETRVIPLIALTYKNGEKMRTCSGCQKFLSSSENFKEVHGHPQQRKGIRL